MNLIISLLGSDNDQLITEKFLIYKKKYIYFRRDSR